MASKAIEKKSDPTSLEDTTFEEGMAALESIVEEMSRGDLPLEKLVASHERAVRLLAHCQRRLEEARERIQVIEAGAGTAALKPFESAGPIGA